MARIEPLAREELPQFEALFEMIEQSMGFVPSSLPTLAKAPGLSQMIANVASHAAGCRYCQARTATHASHLGVGDEKIADLAEHYSEMQIIQIVATISAFGFLNRWNDTMATTLEAAPSTFAAEHLGPKGWDVGKHA